jgi:hypothetical protein
MCTYIRSKTYILYDDMRHEWSQDDIEPVVYLLGWEGKNIKFFRFFEKAKNLFFGSQLV